MAASQRVHTGLVAVPGDVAASCSACVGSSADHQLDTPAASLLTLKSSDGPPAPPPPPPPKSCVAYSNRSSGGAVNWTRAGSLRTCTAKQRQRLLYTAKSSRRAVESMAGMHCCVLVQTAAPSW